MSALPIMGNADGDIQRPEYLLATLMQTEMQTAKIDPIALRLFLLVHFDEVSRLAHKIHASSSKHKAAKPRKPRGKNKPKVQEPPAQTVVQTVIPQTGSPTFAPTLPASLKRTAE